jgi:microcin C transport system substrate-binding protein
MYKFIVQIVTRIALFWSITTALAVEKISTAENVLEQQQKRVANTEQNSEIITSHAISFHDTPKYPKGFKHFDYVNPDAPKAGILKKAVVGTFDSFNTYSVKGICDVGCDYMYDPLMAKSGDEPYSIYGLIASKITYPKDLTWVTYHINPKARFHDGKPITVEDVAFTFKVLTEKASPHYKHLYSIVKEVKILDGNKICFIFHKPIEKAIFFKLSQMHILPKYYWEKPANDISQPTLTPPVCSGPYKIHAFEAGKYVVYKLVDDYWAKDLPVNIGMNNFLYLRTDYFFNESSAFESFKKGNTNIRIETNPKHWKYSYTSNETEKNTWVKEAIDNSTTGIRAFVFNMRKPVFHDRKVREAISLALDFKWINKHLFYDVYSQATSIFNNSDLAAQEYPTKDELALLEPFKEQVPVEVFTKVWKSENTEGLGNWRQKKLKAYQILKKAGYKSKGEYLVDKNGNILQFEILLQQQEFERFVTPFVNNLKQLGIKAKITLIDPSRYINRQKNFEFDMIVHGFFPSVSPTIELESFWGSNSTMPQVGRNFSGISLPALDYLINKAQNTQKRSELITITKCIDRIVLWSYCIIPQWFQPYWPMVYVKNIKHSKTTPRYINGLYSWWWED